MADIQTKLSQAAQRNKDLLATLSNTDHAFTDLEQQNRYISDLEKQLKDANQRITNLSFKRKKELKEHEKYRDSVMKRFAYKVSGKKEKFEERAAKEEREYFEVLQQEHQANDAKENIVKMIDEAKRIRDDLQAQVATHKQAQKDLDTLYESIFQGPSPGFPEEDEREREANDALQEYNSACTVASTEAQALQILSNAQQMLRSALVSMQQALGYSEWDMWGGGATSDIMERNSLHQAEMQVMQANMLVMQAIQISPMSVRPLPPVKISQGNIMSDVIFDNIFTDMAFHDKIRASDAEVKHCANALNQNIQEVRNKHAGLTADLQIKQQRLNEARVDLQMAREDAFTAPPNYA